MRAGRCLVFQAKGRADESRWRSIGDYGGAATPPHQAMVVPLSGMPVRRNFAAGERRETQSASNYLRSGLSIDELAGNGKLAWIKLES